MSQMLAEDAKIVTLARAARARTGASTGAAVRDTDGRTYAATPVGLESLSLSAVQAAVVMAASAGATGLEAVATDADPTSDDLCAARDLGGPKVPVLVFDQRGDLARTLHT